MLTVATWNVLHRIHGENWDEAVVRQWPDERARIAAITQTIAGLDAQVIALQEVSGDQLESLRGLPRQLLAFRYPRLPALRRGQAQLQAPAEYLVVLTDGPAVEVAAAAFATDPGKGLLAVRFGATTIVDTHVSFGDHSRSQLRQLAELAVAAPGAAVVLGDFNMGLVAVAAAFGPGFTAHDPGPAVPSRPRPAGATKSTTIDHVFVRGAAPLATTVLDVQGLSDHNPVLARIRM
jgi:endonuclease/exonuclease/phosphatase family metal-dependent hydrolase